MLHAMQFYISERPRGKMKYTVVKRILIKACDSQMRLSGWNGLKVKAMMVSVKVNRLTLIPVSAFQIVMELGLSITARRSRHASWGRYRRKEHVMCSGTPLRPRSGALNVGVLPSTNQLGESPTMVDLYGLKNESV